MKPGFIFLVASLVLAPLPMTAHAGEAAQHLSEAVRFKTISHQDPGLVDREAFLAFHAYLRTTYPLTFSTLAVETVNDLSLLLEWEGSNAGQAPVLFTAHMDVVPIEPGTEDAWTHPGFAGVIDKGMIYGRGTLDDKVGVISLLEATERLLGEGFVPERDIVLAFGHDEEVSGTQGAAFIAKRLREKGRHFGWMVDEGGLLVTGSSQLPTRQLAVVNVAEKGYYTLRLTATGEGGHSSMPPARTSIGKLAAALTRIENDPFDARLQEPISSMVETLADYAAFPKNLIMGNLWLTSPLVIRGMAASRETNAMLRTTTAVTMFNAGVKENVIPQSAQAFINFRLLPGDTPAMVLARITALVDDPDIQVESVTEAQDTVPVADSRGEGFRVITAAVEAVYPDAVVVPSLLNAATDTRHYIDLADDHYRFHGTSVPQADVGGIHGTDEKISVESFERTVDIAVAMLRGSTSLLTP